MLTTALLPCRFLAPTIALALSFSFGLAERTQARSFINGIRTVEVSPDLLKASHIAEANARPRSVKRCWRYVKRALVAAHVVDHYPEGVSAKYAGRVLTEQHGFTKLKNITAPEEAPSARCWSMAARATATWKSAPKTATSATSRPPVPRAAP